MRRIPDYAGVCAPALLVIGRGPIGRRSETRRQQLCLATLVDRIGVVDGRIHAATARKRTLIIERLRRDAPQLIIDILVQLRYADLRIVDEIRRVLLHHPHPQVSCAHGQMPPDFVVGIALRFEIKCSYGLL